MENDTGLTSFVETSGRALTCLTCNRMILPDLPKIDDVDTLCSIDFHLYGKENIFSCVKCGKPAICYYCYRERRGQVCEPCFRNFCDS